MKPTFHGEVQLAGWSDTHTGGAKVTFWLPDAESLEVFKGLTAKKGNVAGHRFAAVLVEIGEDDQPVIQHHIADAGKEVKGGALAKWAGILCNDQLFYRWVMPVYDRVMGGHGYGSGDVDPDSFGSKSEFCRHCVLVICKIKSRAELDHNHEAGRIFRENIMAPFSEWKEAL